MSLEPSQFVALRDLAHQVRDQQAAMRDLVTQVDKLIEVVTALQLRVRILEGRVR